MAKSKTVKASDLRKKSPLVYLAYVLWLVSLVVLLGNSTDWIALGIFVLGAIVIFASGYRISIVKR